MEFHIYDGKKYGKSNPDVNYSCGGGGGGGGQGLRKMAGCIKLEPTQHIF